MSLGITKLSIVRISSLICRVRSVTGNCVGADGNKTRNIPNSWHISFELNIGEKKRKTFRFNTFLSVMKCIFACQQYKLNLNGMGKLKRDGFTYKKPFKTVI